MYHGHVEYLFIYTQVPHTLSSDTVTQQRVPELYFQEK